MLDGYRWDGVLAVSRKGGFGIGSMCDGDCNGVALKSGSGVLEITGGGGEISKGFGLDQRVRPVGSGKGAGWIRMLWRCARGVVCIR